jgi:hypothetical protein
MKIRVLRNPINPVRNSGRCDTTEWGIKPRPAYRQAVGMILKSNPVAGQWVLFLTGLTIAERK